MIKNIIHQIALTCKEATLLMEQKESSQIGFIENIRLQAHLKICKFCRIYKEKLIAINQFLRGKENDELSNVDESIVEQLKQQISKKLSLDDKK